MMFAAVMLGVICDVNMVHVMLSAEVASEGDSCWFCFVPMLLALVAMHELAAIMALGGAVVV